MQGKDHDFMTLIELISLLNRLQSAAPPPEPRKPQIFIVRGRVALKGKHGIDGIDVIGQGSEQDIHNVSPPGFVGQGFGIGSVQGVRMGQALIPDFLDGGLLRFSTGADERSQEQDFPFRMSREKSGAPVETISIKSIKEDVVFKDQDSFRTR